MNKKLLLPTLVLLFTFNSTFTYGETINLQKNIAQIQSSIQKANYKGADQVVYRTLTQYKDDYTVQALAAVSWALQSKLELAQDQIDKLKDIIPKSSDLHFAQGVVFYKRITSSNMFYRTKADSLLDIAQREFAYAIKLDENNYKAYSALGSLLLRTGDVENARINIEKALELSPDYAIAIDNLGSVYLAEGDAESAEHYFKKAIEINPNTHAAYYHLAQLECNRGNYAMCLTYVNKCLAWQGYSSYAYNLKGDALRLQGNEAAAIVAYKKAVEIAPENLTPYANLAAIYEARKDFELALDCYKSILSINPDSEQTLLKVADMYHEAGKYDVAISFYDKLTGNLKSEAVKGLAASYYGIALHAINNISFSSDKRLLEAYGYLNRAIELNPNDLELYLAKAKISTLLNMQSETAETLSAILNKNGASIDDYLVRGDAYAILGNYKVAFNQYKSAIKLAKTNDDKLFLGEIFTFNKLYDEARIVFNDLLRQDRANILAKNNLAYIDKARSYSDLQVKHAKYFRIRNSMFFEREYLNRALKNDPYNVDANILMGRLNQRQHKWEQAYKCYSIVVAKTTDAKILSQYTKRMNKMKKKIDKQNCKKASDKCCKPTCSQSKKTSDDKVIPVNNINKLKNQEEKNKINNKSTSKKKSKTDKKVKSSNTSTVDYSPKVFNEK